MPTDERCETCLEWDVDPGGNINMLPPEMAEKVKDCSFRCIKTTCKLSGELTHFEDTCKGWKPIPNN